MYNYWKFGGQNYWKFNQKQKNQPDKNIKLFLYFINYLQEMYYLLKLLTSIAFNQGTSVKQFEGKIIKIQTLKQSPIYVYILAFSKYFLFL